MMSEEFKDYYLQIFESVSDLIGNNNYAKELMKKNYFRIKTGFYEDENPDNIIESMVFQINEVSNRNKTLLKENFFDIITNFFKGKDQNDDSAEEIRQYLEQIQDILDENKIFDDKITELLGKLKDSDLINLIDFPTTIRGLKNKLLKPGDKTSTIIEFFTKLINSLPERAKYDEKISQQTSNVTFDDIEDTEDEEESKIPRKKYIKEKQLLQIELLKLQEWVKENNVPVAVVFEGRDTAGKGSTIKKFTEYLDPKYYQIVALGIPTDEEKRNWFQRYEKYIKPGVITFFDRSWYNRGIVEPVMGYSSEQEYEQFMKDVVPFEKDLISKGVILIKFWLSITKDRQEKRFTLRQQSPLKYWKYSPNDEASKEKWDEYTEYKERVFKDTSHQGSPWIVLDSNDKRVSGLNAMRKLLQKINYDDKNNNIVDLKYPEVVSTIKESLILERSSTDQHVRSIVKTLTDIVKSRETRTFYLPEDITDGEKFEYEIDGIPPFSIEFVYDLDEYLEGEYRLDGDYDKDDDVIEIRLTANPNFLPKLLYDLIGDLNDIVRHEMEHLFQNERGELDDDGGDTPKDKSYYLQPKELPAQIQGLRRIARLRKQPIDFVIRSWFQRNKPIHGLNDEDIEELTLFLSSLYDDKFKQ